MHRIMMQRSNGFGKKQRVSENHPMTRIALHGTDAGVGWSFQRHAVVLAGTQRYAARRSDLDLRFDL